MAYGGLGPKAVVQQRACSAALSSSVRTCETVPTELGAVSSVLRVTLRWPDVVLGRLYAPRYLQ